MAAFSVPLRIWAWTAAPRATTSSGFSSVWSLRLRASRSKSCVTSARTAGDARAAADHHYFVDLVGGQLRVFEGLLYGRGGAGDDGRDELLELGTGDLAGVEFAVWEGERDARGVGGAEGDLGIDDGLAELLDDFGVGGDVDA